MPGDNNILPLLDRPAPLLERVRGDNDQNQLTSLLGKLIGDAVKSDDDELLEETHERIQENLADELADNLGVDADDINTEYVSDLADKLINADESDVLSADALESLGIKVEDEAGSDDDDENDGRGELFE